MDEFAGLVENVCAEIGQPVQLGRAIGRIAQEHRYVVVRICARITARSRAEQHHTLEPLTVDLVERGAEAP